MSNEQNKLDKNKPSRQLLVAVRRAFEDRGDFITHYCKRHGLDRTCVYKSLVGTWNGKKGSAMRERIVNAAFNGTDAPSHDANTDAKTVHDSTVGSLS